MGRAIMRQAGGLLVLCIFAGQGLAEAPPADFHGRQFVGGDGCTLQRVVLSGRVIWLPLLDTADQPVCGQGGGNIPAAPSVAATPVAPAAAGTTATGSSSKPPKAQLVIPVGARWVQVGAYGQPANAERVQKSLVALGFSAGLVPVKGGSLTAVVIGPFEKAKDLAAAVNHVRRAGFTGAFAR